MASIHRHLAKGGLTREKYTDLLLHARSAKRHCEESVSDFQVLRDAVEVYDGGYPAVFAAGAGGRNRLAFFVHVDNPGVMGTSEAEVNAANQVCEPAFHVAMAASTVADESPTCSMVGSGLGITCSSSKS